MGISFKDEGRKDTGRTDKYSDESPKKDFADYRKDYPNDNKEPRKEAKDISDRKTKPYFIGPKSIEAKKQELISHIQNRKETDNRQMIKEWKSKLKILEDQLDGIN